MPELLLRECQSVTWPGSGTPIAQGGVKAGTLSIDRDAVDHVKQSEGEARALDSVDGRMRNVSNFPLARSCCIGCSKNGVSFVRQWVSFHL